MERSDTQKILDAIGALGERIGGLETRMGSLESRMEGMETRIGKLEIRVDGLENRMETRMSAMEDRMTNLTQEMRTGFEKIDRRLVALEENVEATNKTLDSVLEGDALGKGNITLTRPEYDTMVSSLHIPNRFAKV